MMDYENASEYEWDWDEDDGYRPCESVWDIGCKAAPGYPDSHTKADCFACGLPVCTNCSRRRNYLRYGLRRLCMRCIEERADDMKRWNKLHRTKKSPAPK